MPADARKLKEDALDAARESRNRFRGEGNPPAVQGTPAHTKDRGKKKYKGLKTTVTLRMSVAPLLASSSEVPEQRASFW